jgi:6-phosphofructo-2-kinase/fructose-2,6-biphosphatase
MDVIQRLEPVIIEIERERECVVVVAHQAVLRALYGYFMKVPLAVRRPPNLASLSRTPEKP